ncbi:MAG: methyltransferase domain-containing protein [Bacteroidota bacterium]
MQLVESFDSAKNGKINVIRLHDKLVVNTRNANQSFDGLHQLFKTIFNDLQLEKVVPQKILCLGLAGGSIIHIIKNELQLNSHITAIEYDEVMVQIANKYFGLQQFSHLNVVIADAFVYAQQKAATETFDLIIVDLFEDNKVAANVFNIDFNEQLLNMCPNGTIIINAICNNKNQLLQLNTLFSFYKNKQNNCILKSYPIAPENKVLIVQT